MQNRSHQKGISLTEVLASMAVMSLLVAGLTAMSLSSVEDTKSQQAALYQSQLGRAVKNWLGDPANRATVAGAATTVLPVKVTLAQLAQWLPPNFAAANAYQQTPCVMVYFDGVADRIDAAITTEGGQVIDDAQLGYVVNHAGEGAGAVYTRAPAVALGPYGSWQAPLNAFTSGAAAQRCAAAPATGGRLISVLSMDRNGTNALGGAGEWLARNAIPGRPELNRMNTSVDMNGNDVGNGRDVHATRWVASGGGVIANNDVVSLTGRVIAVNGELVGRDVVALNSTTPAGTAPRMSQAIFFSHVIVNGDVVNKPTCPAGSAGQIFVSATSKSTNPPRAFFAEHVQVQDLGASWRAILWLYTSAGWVAGDPAVTRLNVNVKCA